MFGASPFATTPFAANENKYFYASGGVYTYSGRSITVLKTNILNAEDGAYSYLGNDSTIICARLLVSENGTYTYNGFSSTNKLFLGDWEFEFGAVDVWTCQDEGETAVWTEETTTPITWN